MSHAGTVDETINPLLGGSMIASAEGAAALEFASETLPCRLVDPELFFAESPADVEYAKSLCRDCPLREVCLASAQERHEPWGVWGGELFVQGVVVARKRPRGRPRKHPLPEPVAAADRQSDRTASNRAGVNGSLARPRQEQAA